MKEEKTMVDIDKIVRLRNLTLTAKDITNEDLALKGIGTNGHSYALGKLHMLEDMISKLNDLIIRG